MNGAARHLDLVAHASVRMVQCSMELSNPAQSFHVWMVDKPINQLSLRWLTKRERKSSVSTSLRRRR
jgi:hypothetical protein